MKQIDITPFVSTDPTRHQINFPRIAPDGNVFATDGRLLIYGAKECFLPFKSTYDWETTKQPDYKAVLCKKENIGKPLTLPFDWRNFPTKNIQCEKCDGKGHVKLCKECKGEGFVECECCFNESKCDACNGECEYPSTSKTDPECEDCDGSGSFEIDSSVITLLNGQPNAVFGLKYLKMLDAVDPDFTLYSRNDEQWQPHHVTFPSNPAIAVIMGRREKENLTDLIKQQYPQLTNQ